MSAIIAKTHKAPLQVQQYSQEGNTMTDQLDNSWCYSASIYI